jgi:histidinol-phosphate aminotransferase
MAATLTRRRFVQASTAGAAGLWVASRGRESSLFGATAELDAPDVSPLDRAAFADAPIIINSNENPVGPYKPVVDAVHGAFDAANRYPFATVTEITALVAKKYGIDAKSVLLGCGSTPLLRSAMHVFASKDKPMVGAKPTFETPGSYANEIGAPIKSVPLTADMMYDLDAMVPAAAGAGVVYICNPNNPVPTAADGKSLRAFISAVHHASPDTVILIDEAYYDYCKLTGYDTMIPLAAGDPRVVVTRTCSKAYGMAGLRLGYAVSHPDTIKAMSTWDGTGAVSVLALAAGRAAFTMDPAILKNEVKRNDEVRTFTATWFADRGYKSPQSQANFIFVDVKRPTKSFRDACGKLGVLVGRDFPPFEQSHCRITVGTMDEMTKAVKVFEAVLAQPA